MTEQRPSIGRIVTYRLSEQDVDVILARRHQANAHGEPHGNGVQVGDEYPMIIVRTFGSAPDSAVNGKVQLDGTDELWVTSVHRGEGERHWDWPARV